MGEIILTEVEQIAKQYMLKVLIEGHQYPCDEEGKTIESDLPKWYDEVKFKRGQKYFQDNRYGILTSNMSGLLTMLADPKGLRVLASTGKSSTTETARKRYVSTILHTVSWYDMDLTPNSKSWASLVRVRKLHLNASKLSKGQNMGAISQTEITLTTFGFMGFALIKPHLLGIRYDNDDDREAFVHFWAVLGYMLGVHDHYNMCLFPLKVVETICHILLRYAFIPLLQIETTEFKQMVTALFNGLSRFVPHMDYEVQMFLAKRMAGIPGYQYDVDLSKEKLCRQIFTSDEHNRLQEIIKNQPLYEDIPIIFGLGVPLIQIEKLTNSICDSGYNESVIDINSNINGTFRLIDNNQTDTKISIRNQLGLSHDENIVIKVATTEDGDENWSKYLNDSKFHELNIREQIIVRWRCRTFKMCEYRIGRYIFESGLNLILYIMGMYHDSKSFKN